MPKSKPLTAQPKILIVDDDEMMRHSFTVALSRAGYRVLQARDGLEGLETAEREKPALIVLDVDMPKMDGWQTLALLREREYRQPIIMLTGHTGIEHRVKGLTAGADDYICKPCDHRELIARVHSALRRVQPHVAAVKVLNFGATRVDLADRHTVRAGKLVELTRTEYAMLELFALHPGRLVTRELMLEVVWGYSRQPNTRTVDTHIWRLRQKLEDNAGEPRWIRAVSAGGGYRMTSDEQVE